MIGWSRRSLGRGVLLALTVAWVFLTITLGVGVAAGELGKDEISCRRNVGKRVEKLVRTTLKEMTECFRNRELGKISDTTDCSDPSQLPGYSKVVRKVDQLLDTTKRICGAWVEMGSCAAPCENIWVTDAPGWTECLVCRAYAESGMITDLVYGQESGSIPDGLGVDGVRCREQVGRAVSDILKTRLKEGTRCQAFEDGLPDGMLNCRAADPRDKIARAAFKAARRILKCSDNTLQDLGACGNELSEVFGCTIGASGLAADGLFQDIYAPKQGVYVSEQFGSAVGTGSADSPLVTIRAGIERAAAEGIHNVYVGEGTYWEQITLESNVNVIGGFSVQTGAGGLQWIRSETATSTIVGGTTAVWGDFVENVVLDHLKIVASDATMPSKSSYGVRLATAFNVLIRDSVIVAGNGGPGLSGVAGSDGTAGGDGGMGGTGCEADGVLGGTCKLCFAPKLGSRGVNTMCPGGTAGGEGGGTSHCLYGPGVDGAAGEGTWGGTGGQDGGTACDGSVTAGGAGKAGSDGQQGEKGAGGQEFGVVDVEYIPMDGETGISGENGSGGGGGGGGSAGDAQQFGCYAYPGAGGGGGAGGCGGRGGTGGTGGGGSFGVWVWTGNATVANSLIVTGAGGSGGAGGMGGYGGPGGAGAYGGRGEDPLRGFPSGPGGDGGRGGNGASGGHGGGGGGGPSVGMVCGEAGMIGRVGNSFHPGDGGPGGWSLGDPGAEGIVAFDYGC